MDVPLELNETWLARAATSSSQKRGRLMPETNRIQAMIPRGATMIFNHAGTAAGIDATYVSGDQKTHLPRLRHARRAEGNEGDVHARRPART